MLFLPGNLFGSSFTRSRACRSASFLARNTFSSSINWAGVFPLGRRVHRVRLDRLDGDCVANLDLGRVRPADMFIRPAV